MVAEAPAQAARKRMVQMNTRIEAGLKESGDDALLRLGYTPSAAVRGLWQFVAAHQDDPAAIRSVIDPASVSELSDEGSRKAHAASALRKMYERTAADLGIAKEESAELPSWAALRAEWYDARLDEGK